MFLFDMLAKKGAMPEAGKALPGRAAEIPTAERHFVNGAALKGPYPDGAKTALFGLGCFWGAEKAFWQMPVREGRKLGESRVVARAMGANAQV